MGKPTRAFRGPGIEQERQFQPIYRALAGGLDSANAQALGFMPIGTMVGTGTEVVTLGGNINWSFAPVTFASSTAAQTVSFSHGLARTPQAYVELMKNPLQAAIIPTSVSSWDSSKVIFAVTADTVSNAYKLLLL